MPDESRTAYRVLRDKTPKIRDPKAKRLLEDLLASLKLSTLRALGHGYRPDRYGIDPDPESFEQRMVAFAATQTGADPRRLKRKVLRRLARPSRDMARLLDALPDDALAAPERLATRLRLPDPGRLDEVEAPRIPRSLLRLASRLRVRVDPPAWRLPSGRRLRRRRPERPDRPSIAALPDRLPDVRELRGPLGNGPIGTRSPRGESELEVGVLRVEALVPTIPLADLDPIWLKHQSLGGDDGELGPAVGGVIEGYWPSRFQPYERGLISFCEGDGAHEVHGAIYGRYKAVDGIWRLGHALTDETPCGDDGLGRFNHFMGGSIFWYPGVGAFMLEQGGILDTWIAWGAETGPLGYPTSDPEPVNTGIQQRFQGGLVFARYGGEVLVLYGPILQKWDAMGGGDGPMSWPTTDVLDMGDKGAVAGFHGGWIWLHPEHGPVAVQGPILSKWQELKGIDGWLGLPVADVQAQSDGLSSVGWFEHGMIWHYPQFGAVALCGPVFKKWLSLGGHKSWLGHPMESSDGWDHTKEVLSGRFQGGDITWNPWDEQWTIRRGYPKLSFVLDKILCVDETNPEPCGDDEIGIAGVATDMDIGSVKVKQRYLGDFWDGKVREYTEVLHSFDLYATHTWPKALALVLIPAELDDGGLPGIIQDLFDQIEEELKAVAVELGLQIGSWVGGLIGSVLGWGIGALLGAAIGKFFEWLSDLFYNEDDTFPSLQACLQVDSSVLCYLPWPDGEYVKGPPITHHVRAHGGEYKLWFHWEAQGEREQSSYPAQPWDFEPMY